MKAIAVTESSTNDERSQLLRGRFFPLEAGCKKQVKKPAHQPQQAAQPVTHACLFLETVRYGVGFIWLVLLEHMTDVTLKRRTNMFKHLTNSL